MSGFRANSIVNRDGTGAPNIPNGIVATGATFTGEISGVNGTFSGNLTIGGTVSYQEVENIDAVGVITAQQGIQVEANGLTVTGVGTFNNSIKVVGVTTADANGLNVAGVITATSLKGSGANLTGVLPTTSAVASGSISNGQPVILQSDGTVTVIDSTAIPQSLGTGVVFESGSTFHVTSTFDSTNGKVVIAYRDNGNSYYGTAVVGTVSGTSISFGTPVVFESAAVSNMSATFDSTNGKVVIAYQDEGNSNYGTAIVGTVSGDSISFGSAVVFESARADRMSTTFDSTNGKVVIVFSDIGNSSYGTAVVGTVSGTSISFGSAVVFESANTQDSSTTFDSTNGKVVIAYRDHGNSGYGTAIIGTVSGTSISFGTPVVFLSADVMNDSLSTTFDSSNDKIIITFAPDGSNRFGKAIIGTVSGTSISFGSVVEFNSGNTQYIDATYDSFNKKVVLVYRDEANSDYGTLIVGTVSGTSISFGSEVVFESGGGVNYTKNVFDSTNGRVVIAYRDPNSQGKAYVFKNASTNLTSTNFLGFSNAAYTDGQTATIQITGSVDDAQSGLTTAKKHYVQNDGTLSTTAGSPSVEAGTAVSATKIIVKG